MIKNLISLILFNRYQRRHSISAAKLFNLIFCLISSCHFRRILEISLDKFFEKLKFQEFCFCEANHRHRVIWNN